MLLNRRSSERLAVAAVVVAGVFYFFAVITAQLPVALQDMVERRLPPFGQVLVGAVGLSLLCVGMGSLFVAAARLSACLYRLPGDPPRSVVSEHLWASAMVILGFVLTIAAWAALP